ARVPSLPGVTISRAGGGTAQGDLTAAGAAAFGTALARQFIAGHARGSDGQDGLFPGGVSIRLAGRGGSGAGAGRGVGGRGGAGGRGRWVGGRAATERPPAAFPMHTLTVTGTNLAGKPDTGDEVDIFNTDNVGRFADPIESVNFFRHGVTKFSVPAGHYWALG